MRLAYVLPVGPLPMSALQLVDAWPHNQRILELLAERHGWQCHALWSGAQNDVMVRGPVVHHVSAHLVRTLRMLRPDVVHFNGLVFARLALSARAALGRGPHIVAQHHGELPGGGAAALKQRAASRLAIDRYLFCGLPGQAEPWRRAGIVRPHTPLADVLEASTDLADGKATDLADGKATDGGAGGGSLDGGGPGPTLGVQDPPLDRGDPMVLWVGRLQHGKDPFTALAAFERFRLSCPRAQLWIVAAAERPLEREVRRRLPPGAHLVGPLSRPVLERWYRAADVLLSTSRHEGSGYALIEAIACGCTPAITELPSHVAIAGTLAAYFTPGDVAGAAQALACAALTAARPGARALARARFDEALRWEHVVDQLDAAYRSR